MGSLSVRDYARAKGVSYQAIRRSVNKYRAELEGHISKQNNAEYLDEEAQRILDEKRQFHPMVVIEEQATKEIDRLKQIIEDRDEEIKKLQQDIIKLHEDKEELIEIKGKYTAFIEDKERTDKQIRELREEIDAFKPSIFGFYRKS